MATLNIENKIVAFGDVAQTNNPRLRYVDWYRNVQGIAVATPRTESFIIGPDETVDVAGVSLAGAGTSEFIQSVTIDDIDSSGLRTRLFGSFGDTTGVITALDSITVKPSGLVDFTVSDITQVATVVSGNVFYVKGYATLDGGGNPINQINEGLWKVVKVTGAVMTCQKLDGNAAISQSAIGVLGMDYSLIVCGNLQANQGNYLAFQLQGTLYTYGALYKILYADSQRIDIEPLKFDLVTPVDAVVSKDRFSFAYVEADGMANVTYQLGGQDFYSPIIPLRISADQKVGWFQITTEYNYLNITNIDTNPINVTVVVGG